MCEPVVVYITDFVNLHVFSVVLTGVLSTYLIVCHLNVAPPTLCNYSSLCVFS